MLNPRIPLLIVMGAACTETRVEVDVAREWEGDFLVDRAIIDCDERDWHYDVWTQGWGEEITVDIVVRDNGLLLWTEHHSLPEVDHGPDWAHHSLTLDVVFEDAEQVDGETTRINCEAKTLVTYGFGAWRLDGALEECIGWGIDPEGEFPDCANWGQVKH